MLQSIRDFTKGKLGKVLLGILIVPFVLWGMGSVFGGGSQNTIATLNEKKISISDYINKSSAICMNIELPIRSAFSYSIKISPISVDDGEYGGQVKIFP